MDKDPIELAKVAFDAFRLCLDGQRGGAGEYPKWDDHPGSYQLAWVAAVSAVVLTLRQDLSAMGERVARENVEKMLRDILRESHPEGKWESLRVTR